MYMEMTFPRKIIGGEGALGYLKTLKGKKAFIVMSGSFARSNSDTASLVNRYLDEAGYTYDIIYSQGQEPTLDYVKESAKKLEKFAPDTIIAVGGGSTLDAAKIMKVFYECPGIGDEALFNRFNLPPMYGKATVIAIPTTSGTGSEVTPYNVVFIKTDNPDIPYIKSTVADYQTIPDIVILDPTFTESVSPAVTSNTGMDALVHAIEAYISKKSKNILSDVHALEAIKTIFEYLPRAYKNSSDIEARAKMQYAATMAGIAIANRGTGLAHGAGQQLGPVFGITHGLSVSIVLVPVLKFNYDVCAREYLDIAHHMGINGDTEYRTVEMLFDKINNLIDAINFPTRIQQIGIDKKDYLEKMDIMARNALQNGATLTNPKMPTIEDVKNIFLSIC